MEWSELLPSSCPPDDAESKSILVYRFLKNHSEIKPECFKTVREENPDKSPFRPIEKECLACSLSVLADREEVIGLQRRVPRWRIPAAVGVLNPNSGRIKHTPSSTVGQSHHSWWIPTSLEAWTLFHEIIEPPKTLS